MAPNFLNENQARSMGHKYIVGIDESGMGCFAGDVYVAAVMFEEGIDYKALMPGLNDSKKKSPEKRGILYKQIKKHALAYSVATASVAEIDKLNIYWARFLAARRAIDKLVIRPDFIIIDGNKEIPEIDIPQIAVIKGDAKSVSVAAASILAKIERDIHIMELSDLVHEDYEWKENKSYYSLKQIEAIKKHGKTKWHREKYVAKYFEKE